jgi:formylglycine-generating enzyme required for sulfatase activity
VVARWLPIVVLVSAAACRTDRARPDATRSDEPAPSAPPPQPIALRPRVVDAGAPRAAEPVRALPTAGATVRFAAGRHRLGSAPGQGGRDPSVEADDVEVSVPAFDIDALPYPNDPSQPARSGATRDEAQRACAERGRRLCSEIEWERACRGPEATVFPGGAAWDGATCGRGELGACATAQGVLAMGTRMAEWTRDDLESRAVIRGAGRDAPAAMHRCAARRTADPAATGLELAFRCCGGEAPAITYPREVSRRPFREEPMTAAQLTELVRATPELERLNLRDGLAMFLPGAITEVMNHGATSVANHPEYTFTVNAVRWSPVFGEEVLVVTAKSRPGSWIAAFYVLPNGGYRHAASFLLRDDPLAVTLAFGAARREVAWATCWACGGESGVIAYDEENRVVIVQR